MLLHMVSFTWKPGTTAEDIDRIQTAIGTLPDDIPVIVGYAMGSDLGVRDGNADFGVVALLDTDNPADYLEHPAHLDVATRFVFPHVLTKSSVQARIDRPLLRETLATQQQS